MKTVCVLALPDTLASSLGLPLEMFNAAGEQLRLSQRRRAVDIRIVGLQAGTVRAAGGLQLAVEHSYRDIERADLVILPTRWRHPRKPLADQAAFLDWLKAMVNGGARVCTGGTSSFLLAATGLLDGKPATTHWHYFEEFARRFPQVELKTNYLITEAGPLYCAGSVGAMADMMVHLIGQFFGTEIAHRVERQFSPEIRRPFHSHAFRVGQSDLHQDEAIAYVQSWLMKHYAEEVSSAALATMSGLSERNFHRRFKRAAGQTPHQYLLQIRVDNARELLRHSNLPVEDIAAQVGYGDTSYFCKLFRKHSGQTPAEYRRAVRAKLFAVKT